MVQYCGELFMSKTKLSKLKHNPIQNWCIQLPFFAHYWKSRIWQRLKTAILSKAVEIWDFGLKIKIMVKNKNDTLGLGSSNKIVKESKEHDTSGLESPSKILKKNKETKDDILGLVSSNEIMKKSKER